MKLKVFAIKDRATEVFHKPFFMLTKAEAIRMFTHEVNTQSDSQLYLHPHDFHLYYLGTFDQDSGFFTQDEAIQDLGSAATFRNEPETSITEMFPAKDLDQERA